MKAHRLNVIGVAAALALAAGMAAAQAPATPKSGAQPLTREQMREQMREQRIYGYQLMTPDERNAYRAKMRAAKTLQERERIRTENHAAMQARAKQRGVTLPPEPKVGRSVGAVRVPGPGTGVAPRSGPGGTGGGK